MAIPVIAWGIGAGLAGSQLGDVYDEVKGFFSDSTDITHEKKMASTSLTPLNLLLLGAGAFLIVSAYKKLN